MASMTHLLFLILATLLTLGAANPLSSPDEKLETQLKSEKAMGRAEDPQVYISYRRSNSRHLAMLIKLLLEKENISAYLDVDEPEQGLLDEKQISILNSAPNFVLILSNQTLDRCVGDTDYTDYLHKEIQAAVLSPSSPLIIPVFDFFDFPSENLFSPEIQFMLKHQGLTWEHALTDGSIKKLIKYLKEEPSDMQSHVLRP